MTDAATDFASLLVNGAVTVLMWGIVLAAFGAAVYGLVGLSRGDRR